ncbi:peptidoglycan-binding domain-containing protein [Streptomyces luteogriseus]|uniref:peptidoglycan-binding domain-containing protein n=2 Tax=Streptomyces luteogriseus TaxID=68233 RepID=UPI002E34F100|nr:peptidoglycan-binding domain-containing protein [Streptomyces luteogriseus]WTJ26003.1 peptidoglycan-binding protein [Streptomyces luteogriseus]
MSTPSEPRPPHDGQALEPIRVLRPRRTDALAELMREFRQETGRDPGRQDTGREPGGYESGRGPGGYESGRGPGGYESLALPGPPAGSEALTQELPPVAREIRRPTRAVPPGVGLRRAAVAVAVLAAAVIGFGGALLLRGEHKDDSAAPAPAPPRAAPSTPDPTPTPPGPAAPADPDGAGTLREGATGPEVTELQQRLLDIPDVYRDGSTNGSYDPTLTAAVARFQLWYGIRGDETGVYGNDTRAALESRTS